MKKIAYILLALLFWSCLKEEAIPVVVDFEYEVIDNDFSIPVSIVFFNRTEGADQYEWRFEGANLNRSVDRNPGIIKFNTQGTHAITLTATNIDGSEDSKTLEIKIDDPVVIDFKATNMVSTFPPATYKIENRSTGANTYKWIFEGGVPATSSDQDPGEIVFDEPGEHQIHLEISNGRETYTMSTTVEVAPRLTSDFDFEINFDDDDFQIPAKVKFTNKSVSATEYTWTLQGANIISSNEKDIEVIFNRLGEQEITLTTGNGKDVKTSTQSITFFRNTNLREFKDVKLGINTAHQNNSVGSFFSTATREVYTQEQLSAEIEANIDLVFYGLNSTFVRNQFISPDQLSNTPFNAFQNPKSTVFINTQELCACPIAVTTQQFDEMTDDTVLKTLSIDADDDLFFDNTVLPRIVLFKTEEGKKGAIKIKNFVATGDDSYIVVDIKVQKEKR